MKKNVQRKRDTSCCRDCKTVGEAKKHNCSKYGVCVWKMNLLKGE